MTKTPLRVKLAAWILCGVFAVSLLAFADVQVNCRRLRRETESILSLLDDGAEDSTLDAAVSALGDRWAHDDLLLRLALPGDVLADLNEAIARLPAETAEPESLRAELLSIAADLRFLCRQEYMVL